MRRRTLATLKCDGYAMMHRENREWLAKALTMIVVELEKGEHVGASVLEIFEAESRHQARVKEQERTGP